MELTVKRLKAFLENVPDEAFIMIGNGDYATFPEAIHITENGTHPSITIVHGEIFLDE